MLLWLSLIIITSWTFITSVCLDINITQLPNKKQTYIYIYLEPQWPLFLKVNTTKRGQPSNQNKGHLGSRYVYIYTYVYDQAPKNLYFLHLQLCRQGADPLRAHDSQSKVINLGVFHGVFTEENVGCLGMTIMLVVLGTSFTSTIMLVVCKDPYETTSIMESKDFFRASHGEVPLAPENVPGPKRKGSSSNHPFLKAMLNFRGVGDSAGIYTFPAWRIIPGLGYLVNTCKVMMVRFRPLRIGVSIPSKWPFMAYKWGVLTTS